jgi:NADH dehydrogenase (ubiquinone) 1 alpha subcomplex subunit 9
LRRKKRASMKLSRKQTQMLRNLVGKQNMVNMMQQKRYAHQRGLNFKGTFSKDLVNPHSSFPVATVFGASGFLGRYITASLADIGYQVIVPYRYSDYNIMGHLVMGDIGQIIGMRFNPDRYDTIVDICARSNVVVNATGRDINKIFDNNMEYSNVFLTEQIVKACRETAVDRFIHISCLGAEKSHPSKYMRQKARAEEIVKEQFPHATIFKPAPVYGTEDHFLNWIAKCLRILPGVPLFNAGSATIQPVYCVDVGDAVANSVAFPDAIGRTVELAGPETLSYNRLVDIVADIIAEPPSRLHLPPIVGKLVGMVNEYTWRPAFTADFVNRVQYSITETEDDPEILKFKDLGIKPQHIETAAREFLARWKRNPDYFLDVNYKK